MFVSSGLSSGSGSPDPEPTILSAAASGEDRAERRELGGRERPTQERQRGALDVRDAVADERFDVARRRGRRRCPRARAPRRPRATRRRSSAIASFPAGTSGSSSSTRSSGDCSSPPYRRSEAGSRGRRARAHGRARRRLSRGRRPRGRARGSAPPARAAPPRRPLSTTASAAAALSGSGPYARRGSTVWARTSASPARTTMPSAPPSSARRALVGVTDVHEHGDAVALCDRLAQSSVRSRTRMLSDAAGSRRLAHRDGGRSACACSGPSRRASRRWPERSASATRRCGTPSTGVRTRRSVVRTTHPGRAGSSRTSRGCTAGTRTSSQRSRTACCSPTRTRSRRRSSHAG